MNTSSETHVPSTSNLTAILKRWPIVALVSVAFFALAVVGILHLKTFYTAQITMVLPETASTDLAEKAQQVGFSPADPFVVRSYLDIAKDDAISRVVINNLALTQIADFEKQSKLDGFLEILRKEVHAELPPTSVSGQQAAEDRALVIYRKRLTVLNDGRSLTVQLSFTARNPNLAVRIANAHAKAFLDSQIAYRSAVATQKTFWLRKQLDVAAADLRSAQISLQTHLVSTSPQIVIAADQTAELKSRQSVVLAKQHVYEGLLARFAVMAAEEKYTGPEIRVVAPATIPTIPSYPNIPVFAAIAAVMSLLVGMAVALLVSALERKRPSAKAVADDLGLRLFGSVPIPTRPWLISSSRRLSGAHFWEQIRRIRCVVRGGSDSAIVAAVTSYLPNEGKSLVAASLARSIASSGSRTLLIDLDLRRPNAHKLLGVPRNETAGLGEALCKKIKTSEFAISADPSGTLFLLTGASNGINDVDVLASAQLKALLVRLKREFRTIILDTPPLGVVSDALNAVTLADTTVLVAESSIHIRENVTRAVEALESCAVAAGGLVVTTRSRSSDTGYSYLSGYATSDKMIKVAPLPVRWRFQKVAASPLWEHSRP